MFKCKKFLIIGIGLLLFALIANANENNFYFDAFSVKQGGQLGVYLDNNKKVDLEIYRTDQASITFVTKIRGIKPVSADLQKKYDKVFEPYVNGAGWKRSAIINVGRNWPSGIYAAVLYDSDPNVPRDDNLGYAYFIVKSARPGSSAKILLLDNAPTKVAYNEWGGQSFYKPAPPNQATSVSLFRPGQFSDQHSDIYFAIWAQNNGFNLEYASMFDLETDAHLLDSYSMVVMTGHNEYWSQTMRDKFDTFIKRGGKAMILGGNTLWWKVRFNFRTGNMICLKQSSDHFYNTNDPENKSIGVGYVTGGFVNSFGWLPADPSDPSNTNGAYTVVNSNHWVFDGVRDIDPNFGHGSLIGKNAAIVGDEVDSALFTIDAQGNYNVTGEDGTPLNTTILAVADAICLEVDCPGPVIDQNSRVGHATMVLTEPFQNGRHGLVFNAATIRWTNGLYDPSNGSVRDETVSRITKNVVNRFLGYNAN